MEHALSLVFVASELLSLALITDGMLKRKDNSLLKFYVILLLSVILAVATAIFFRTSPVLYKFGSLMLTLIFMLSVNYEGAFGYKLFLCLVFFTANSVLDYLTMSVYMMAFSFSYTGIVQNSAIYIVSAFTSKLTLLTAAYFFKKFRHQKSPHNTRLLPFTWSLLIVPTFSIFNIVFVIDSAIKRNEISVWIFADAIGLLMCNIFMIFLWDKFEEENQIRIKNILLQQEIKNNMENLLALENSYKKQRSLTHEFQNHVNVVRGLLENNSIEQALAHVRYWTKNISPGRQVVNTNNQIIDIVLNQKYEYARQHGITMSFLINDLSGIDVKDEDIVTLLTNALDNALEAALLCESEKSIHVKIMRNIGFHFLISVRNTSNPVQIVSSNIKSSKANSSEHGFGLQNIRQIVRKYDGDYVVRYEYGWFQFTAILPETT